ncbi:malonate transporter, MadL subunit [Fictibacillus enclensis]|uniref:Malonate transporter n=1 Tax=Fictibacillus enclensis TaxID=1017270 RepID=A0A0V8JC56_9BACL|nr:malonate transporter subunit MadL [Fictibacillus enclensis]KSU84513.1 malonate transporter [Fictibacillus enclensis]SCB80741.1 malonate transporter, MadL subunit [Fictibacillus enclensis]
MVIYGVALLAICTLVGAFVGDLLGIVLGVESNVGGVGVGMLLLVLIVDALKKRGKLELKSQEGLNFWSSMYIPIVVAMSAQQNVVAAVKGGPLALIAGAGVVAVSFLLVPILSKIGQKQRSTEQVTPEYREEPVR